MIVVYRGNYASFFLDKSISLIKLTGTKNLKNSTTFLIKMCIDIFHCRPVFNPPSQDNAASQIHVQDQFSVPAQYLSALQFHESDRHV